MAWEEECEAADHTASSQEAEMDAHTQLAFSFVIQLPQPTEWWLTLNVCFLTSTNNVDNPSQAYAEVSLPMDSTLCQVNNINRQTLHTLSQNVN